MAELHAMDALREKQSELGGVVSRLEQQRAQHRGSLAYLDATMWLFDPGLVSQDTGLAPQRERVWWFRPGECRRLIHHALRDAPQPSATRGWLSASWRRGARRPATAAPCADPEDPGIM